MCRVRRLGGGEGGGEEGTVTLGRYSVLGLRE